jgi:hypothetical protein
MELKKLHTANVLLHNLCIRSYSSAEHQNSTCGEPHKNFRAFAIHFKVTLEMPLVSRRNKLEHEVAEKQKTSEVARPE